MDYITDNQTSVSKLDINGQRLYIKLLWENGKESLFHINLYESSNCWSGRFSGSTEFSSLVEEPEAEYNNNVKQAFMGSSDFKFDFNYVPGESTAKLNWKKVFDDSTEMPYGSVDLNIDEKESKDCLLDFLLNENKKLKDQLEVYDRRNTTLCENLEKSKNELNEFVNEKISFEANLYGKFVQLLNEKKERIRLLENLE